MKQWLPFMNSQPSVAVIRLAGTIAANSRGGLTLNDAGLAPMIERAFKRRKPVAVALVINSPGGSPAQSSLIAARIQRLSEEKNIPVFAFVEDVAASGGYWLATAADQVFVDSNSIVGSIGVISAGFGFTEMIEKIGVERRVHTSGESKSILDPFKPEQASDIKILKSIQGQIHASFIEQVKSRRGGRLAEGKQLFNGEFWVGQTAVDLGLADGVGHLVPVMRERYGDKVKFISYGQKRPLFSRIGARVASDLLGVAEERAQYARFGL